MFFKIQVIIEPDEAGFHAYCPALKGLHTYGETEEEALENARNAAIAYLRSLIKHNDPIPVGIIVHEEIVKKTPITTPPHYIRHSTKELVISTA